MVIARVLFLLLVLFGSVSAIAQQIIPELDSDRVYIPFTEAAEKIIAAAVSRSSPGRTEDVPLSESFRRIVEYAKQGALKQNVDIGGPKFSYMSFLPQLAGKLNGEIASYSFSTAFINVVSEREAGSFSYKMRPVYETPFYIGPRGGAARIYSADLNHAFKTLPVLKNGVLSYTNLCTNAASSCFVLNTFPPGSFKWFFRDGSQGWIVACNQVSDCVQANISMMFYNWTFNYRSRGSDPSQQYWGNYRAAPSGTCNDSADYAFLSYGMISGMACIFSIQYEVTSSTVSNGFVVNGDAEQKFLRYISLGLVPFVCPGATKYPDYLACDPRFAVDVLTQSTLARLVDRMYFWGAQRDGYRGVNYTPVTNADVAVALGNTLVKVSSLASELKLPTATPPAAAASAPGSGASSPVVDLGADPGIGAPAVDPATASAILAPIWDLFPSLRSYQAGGVSAQCPVYTASFYGRSFLINAHCELAQGQRVALGVVSLFAWAATALLIVVRA